MEQRVDLDIEGQDGVLAIRVREFEEG